MEERGYIVRKCEKRLCLATYNIWNSDDGMPFRAECIVKEIQKIKPDILCLQEVKDKTMAYELADKLEMSCYFINYENNEEGICVLSTYPIIEKEDWTDVNAQYVTVQYNLKTWGIVNTHLPWDSVIKREKYISKIVSGLAEKNCDYVFILGDFNSGNDSNVFRMLKGECSLYETEANPCYYDLALASAQVSGVTVKSTLDFQNNPRFHENTIEISQRFDRIFLRNTYPVEFPRLVECDVFGTKVYSEIDLCASDHYGVYAVVESEEKYGKRHLGNYV